MLNSFVSRKRNYKLKHYDLQSYTSFDNNACGPTFMQAWSSPDLGLGLETSGDPVLEVFFLVLVSKTYSLGLVLETLY